MWLSAFVELAKRTRILVLSVHLLFASPGHALTLTEALERARQGDPAYLTAQGGLVVAQERANQAFAGLLPQVNASGNTNYSHRIYTTRTTPSTTFDEKFNSNAAQVNLFGRRCYLRIGARNC